MNLGLMGYYGSGKSCVGKLLADQLWWTLVDLDEFARQGLSDDQLGDLLAEVAAKDEQVIALPSRLEGLSQRVEAIRPRVRLAYLQAPAESLVSRISACGGAQIALNQQEFVEIAGRNAAICRNLADTTLDTMSIDCQSVARLIIRMVL